MQPLGREKSVEKRAWRMLGAALGMAHIVFIQFLCLELSHVAASNC